MSAKQKVGLAEKNKGRRTAGQVIANAGVAAILGILAMFYPAKVNLFRLMTAAAIASAAADTLSSELGNIYGKTFTTPSNPLVSLLNVIMQNKKLKFLCSMTNKKIFSFCSA